MQIFVIVLAKNAFFKTRKLETFMKYSNLNGPRDNKKVDYVKKVNFRNDYVDLYFFQEY